MADDLSAAVDYYVQLDEDLPKRLRKDAEETFGSISLFPFLGAPAFGDYRHLVFRVFPYMAIYRVKDSIIRVLAVVHVRRDPDWIKMAVDSRLDNID